MLQRAVWFAYRICYARYVMASAIALGADLASFLLMLNMKVPAVPASMIGYSFGLVVHWLLSSRLVFTQGKGITTANRTRQQLLFVVSAIIGLGITALIIECGLRLGIDPGMAKLLAIAISFQATYILRRKVIFS